MFSKLKMMLRFTYDYSGFFGIYFFLSQRFVDFKLLKKIEKLCYVYILIYLPGF